MYTIHLYIIIHIHTYIHTYIHTLYVRTYVRTYVCMDVCMYVFATERVPGSSRNGESKLANHSTVLVPTKSLVVSTCHAVAEEKH